MKKYLTIENAAKTVIIGVALLMAFFVLRAVALSDITVDPCALVTIEYASLAQLRDCGIMGNPQ